MSQENVEIVREAYRQFLAAGEFQAQFTTEDFVWDMTNYHGWPEQQLYEGHDGATTFLREWVDAWEDWEFEYDALLDAGDKVVALVRQRGISKAVGTPVEMVFAQVFTMRDGKEARMEMYSDRDDALAAAGLSP